MSTHVPTTVFPPPLQSHRLGWQPYLPVWRAMQLELREWHPGQPDRLWHVEHPPVFTLGRHARLLHLHNPGATPVVRVDRGGQVTLHRPGQAICYLLLDLRQHSLGVRSLVELLEAAMIAVLNGYGLDARSRRDAPGVYVQGEKIAALGLRVREGLTMHGLALNVRTRLDDFQRIDACGYPGLATTSLLAQGIDCQVSTVANKIEQQLAMRLRLAIEQRAQLPPSLLRILALPGNMLNAPV